MKKSIKLSKILIKILKLFIFIEKSIYLNIFNHFWYIFIQKDSFQTFRSFFGCWNRFRHNDLDSDNEFRSKKSIKRRFESDFKLNLPQGRTNRISLVENHWSKPQNKNNVLPYPRTWNLWHGGGSECFLSIHLEMSKQEN